MKALALLLAIVSVLPCSAATLEGGVSADRRSFELALDRFQVGTSFDESALPQPYDYWYQIPPGMAGVWNEDALYAWTPRGWVKVDRVLELRKYGCEVDKAGNIWDLLQPVRLKAQYPTGITEHSIELIDDTKIRSQDLLLRKHGKTFQVQTQSRQILNVANHSSQLKYVPRSTSAMIVEIEGPSVSSGGPQTYSRSRHIMRKVKAFAPDCNPEQMLSLSNFLKNKGLERLAPIP